MKDEPKLRIYKNRIFDWRPRRNVLVTEVLPINELPGRHGSVLSPEGGMEHVRNSLQLLLPQSGLPGPIKFLL